MRPEEFEAFKREMEELGIRVTNSTPKDSADETVRGEIIASPRRQFREWYTRQEEDTRDYGRG